MVWIPWIGAGVVDSCSGVGGVVFSVGVIFVGECMVVIGKVHGGRVRVRCGSAEGRRGEQWGCGGRSLSWGSVGSIEANFNYAVVFAEVEVSLVRKEVKDVVSVMGHMLGNGARVWS